jgi:hypothetical protein
MSEGVIYVMSNASFMIKDHYKIGFTTDIEMRKKAYVTSLPVTCEWPYVSDKKKYIRTRERLIFQRLKDYRFNDKREFFICPIETIKSTIEEVLKMSLKDMNAELIKEKESLKDDKDSPKDETNLTDWKSEVQPFLKKVVKKTTKAKYTKVVVEDLHRIFSVWCMAKNIKKKVNRKEFEDILEEEYILKTTKNNPKEYLEKIEYKV